MRFWNFFLLINLIWFLSEIIIGRLTFRRTKAQQTDRKSLRRLWLTILPAVFTGVFLGISGQGRLPFPAQPVLILGSFLIVLGLAVRWWAVLTLRHFFTSNVQILEDHQLIDAGPYGLIRHPAYAGSLLSFLGLGLAFNSWLSIVVIFVPIFLAFSFRIKVEEEALLNAFGAAYREYRARTKKLIPFVY